jgi:hypothetical protein
MKDLRGIPDVEASQALRDFLRFRAGVTINSLLHYRRELGTRSRRSRFESHFHECERNFWGGYLSFKQ